MLCAPVFAKIKKWFALQVCYIILVAGFVVSLMFLRVENNLETMEKYRLINSDPNNTLANVNFGMVNVWEPKRSYYVMFLGLTLIDDFLFNRYPDYDINKYLEENKIKYIDWLYAPYTPLYFEGDEYFSRFTIKTPVRLKYIKIYNDLWQRIDTLDTKTEIMTQEK